MKKWIEDGCIYQINIRSLAAREPRNAFEALTETVNKVSSLTYITENIHLLKKIGVTILHIMPPYVMGELERKGIGSPYAAKDYLNIDPEYGTMDQFNALVREAHQLGFRVILGMVPNHTSRDNVWIESNPEYFVKNDSGAVMYDLDWSDTAKLDYNHPDLRRAMFNVYDFWLSCLGDDGVDGFRIDMAHFINDRSFWDATIPRLKGKYADRELLFLAECYGIDNSMDMFRRGFNASYDDAYYKLMEQYYGTTYEGESRLIDVDHPHANSSHSPYFGVFQEEGYAGVIQALFSEYTKEISTLKDPVYFARYSDNHDEGRGAWRFGVDAVKVLNSLACCTPNCLPFLLTGEEFGAVNRPSIHNRFGICDKGRQVWNGDGWYGQEGIEFEGNLFCRGTEERRAMLTFFQSLYALRKDHAVLRTGSMTFLETGENVPKNQRTVVAFDRKSTNQHIRCIFNLGHEPRAINADLLGGRTIFGAVDENTMPAFGSLVMELL